MMQKGEDKDELIHEYKQVCEDRRYYMGRYQYFLFFAVTVVGAIIKLISDTQSQIVIVSFSLFSWMIGGLAIYVIQHFRDLVYHSLNREKVLAKKLGFQAPYELMWGYYAGLILDISSVLGITILAIIRYINLT